MRFLYICFLIFSFTTIFISGCEKTEAINTNNYTIVYLHNLAGLDGCGWELQTEGGEWLEPVNLSEFDIEYTEGAKCKVVYHIVDGVSICMIGKIIELETFFQNN